MDLRQFVSATLESVLGGVTDAQKSDVGQLIGPTFRFDMDHQKDFRGMFVHGSNNYTIVEFDVAVMAADALSGGGGLTVAGLFKVGAQGETSTSHTSRVKFSVPVKIPQIKGT